MVGLDGAAGEFFEFRVYIRDKYTKRLCVLGLILSTTSVMGKKQDIDRYLYGRHQKSALLHSPIETADHCTPG